MTIVCGDSHTATHGAFGALAFGIGTSEVEHVLATQTLLQSKPKTLELRVDGQLAPRRHGQGRDSVPDRPDRRPTAAPATVIEYTGEAIRGLSMEERMTVCNMSIEAGARAGMIAPDETTFDYLRGREFAPQGQISTPPSRAGDNCPRDPGAKYDTSLEVFDAADIAPQVTWGTNPGQVAPVIGQRARSRPTFGDDDERKAAASALEYMGLERRHADAVDSRSTACSSAPAPTPASKTCGRRRRGARLSRRQHACNAMVVPGSGQVKQQAENEGLDRVFKEAGFDWREAGCSMCLAMNPDMLDARPALRLAPAIATSKAAKARAAARTWSRPAMAAAAAIAGHFVDIREWEYKN